MDVRTSSKIPLHLHSPWPGTATTECRPDPDTSLITCLLTLTHGFTDTKVTFLIHRCDYIMPLLRNLIWLPTISGQKSKLIMLPLRSSMILIFCPLDSPQLPCVSLEWSGGSYDGVPGLCKLLVPTERVAKHKISHQIIKGPAQLPMNSSKKKIAISLKAQGSRK